MMRPLALVALLSASALAEDAGIPPPPAPPVPVVYAQCLALEVAAGTEPTAAALICLVRVQNGVAK